MDRDDIIYLSILLSSICLGYLFQYIKSATGKKLFSTSVGFLVCSVVSGVHVVHPLGLTFVTACVIKFSRRYCHTICFGLGFSYLSLLRVAEYWDVFHPSGHTNIIQMILTLKVIGLAFEVHDNRVIEKKLKSKNEVSDQEMYKVFPEPSTEDVFHYVFCYAGILTGPYFTYRVYLDALQHPYRKYKFCFRETARTLASLPALAFLFLQTMHLFPLSQLTDEKFITETSYLYRLLYIYPTFFIFRMRMYIAFKLSEAVCMMAGLGMYPTVTEPKLGSGPSINFGELGKSGTEVDYSFETVHTINIYEAEFASTVREGTRHWNRTIQYWLAAYVYRRFPFKKYRTTITFFISSLWHGMHAGYYFSLFSVPFYLFVESVFQKRVLKGGKRKWEKCVLWNAKMFQFSYWGLAFQAKNFSYVWRYSVSIGFAPYAVALVMYTVSMFF